MNTTLDHSTYLTGVLQANAYRNLRIFMAKSLDPHKITCSEWSILGIIHEESKNGGIKVSALAKMLHVQVSFITNMVSKLQSRGYIKHTFDEDDGRVRLLVGTDKAHLKVIEIESKLRRDMRDWLADVSPNDLFTYIKVLDQLSNKNV